MQQDEYEDDEPQGIRPSAVQNPMHMYGSAIMQLTNPDNELHRMELTFRSEIINKDGEPVMIAEPLMNDKGIASVIGQVQAIVNRVTIFSNLNKAEIPMLMDFLADTLAKDLMVNRISYGLNTISARDRIYYTALTTAFVTMKRAYEEGDKRFWKGSVQEIHSKVEQSQKSRGLLSKLSPWSK